jgi:hypothetical protein
MLIRIQKRRFNFWTHILDFKLFISQNFNRQILPRFHTPTATARANYYGAILVNFDQSIVEMDQFEESPIDDDPISILYHAMAGGLLAEDSCNVCQSFYDTLKKPGMKVNDSETRHNDWFCNILISQSCITFSENFIKRLQQNGKCHPKVLQKFSQENCP